MPGSARTSGVPLPTKDFDTPQPFELLESFDQHHVHRAQAGPAGFAGWRVRSTAAMRAQPVSDATMTSEAPRQAVSMAVLAGHVELDVVVVRVLDGRDAEARGLATRGSAFRSAWSCRCPGVRRWRRRASGPHPTMLAPSSLPTPQAATPAPPPINTMRRPPRNALSAGEQAQRDADREQAQARSRPAEA